MKHDHILISLADPVGFVRSQYREYALEALNRYCGQGALPFKTVEYDAIDFFVALVQEINSADETADSLGTPPQSTNLLLRAGLDVKAATWIAFEAHKGITDAISTMVPEATFGAGGEYSYAFIDGHDLLITRPAQGVAIPYGLRMGGPTITDEMVHQGKISPADVHPAMVESVTPEPQPTAMPGIRWHFPPPELYDQSLPSLSSRDIDNLPGGLPPEARE